MSEQLFQIVSENDFEVVIKKTTLEECTDVVYTSKELLDLFNGGKSFPYHSSSSNKTSSVPLVADSSYSPSLILKPDNIASHLRIKFADPKVKVVCMEMTPTHCLGELNNYFKQFGFMYSPSKEYFVRWKEPKKKVPSVAASVLSDLRGRTIDCINKIVAAKADFLIEFKYCCEKEKQLKVLRFGKLFDIDLDTILEYPFFVHGWDRDEHGSSIKTGIRFSEYLTNLLTRVDKLDTLDITMEAYKSWYQSAFDPIENVIG